MEGINTDNAPSTSVVVPHFVAAALFFLVLAVLVFISSGSLNGHYFETSLLAITHIAALGWGTMVIFGALYQLIPVIFETTLYSERLAKINFWIFIVGIITLSYSFWNASFTGGLFHSSIVLFSALMLFIFNVVMSFRKTKKRNYSSKFIITSFIWLFLTAVLGLATAINFRVLFLPGVHLDYLVIHAHLGFVGWFLQLIMGVAATLVPMFLVAHDLNEKKLRNAFWLVNAGLTFITLDWLFLGGSVGLPLYWVLISLAILFYLSYLYDSYKNKLRKLDVGMQHTMLAFCAIILPLIVAFLLLADSFIPGITINNSAILYGFVIIFGFISTLILGQTYKTLPFIIWLNKYQALVGKHKVPMPRELYSEKVAYIQLLSWFAALITIIGGLIFSNPILIKTGSVFFVLTALLYNFNVLKIVLHTQVKIEQKESAPAEKDMMSLLKTVIDPEVEINIVDLGLIYKLEYNDNKHVDIDMTFSTKACPLGDTIVMNVIECINSKYPELEVNVQVVFDPPWTPERISEEGKKVLAKK